MKTPLQYPMKGTVRWHVTEWVRKNIRHGAGPYLDVGSFGSSEYWWRDMKQLLGMGDAKDWYGLDAQEGPDVDIVMDLTDAVIPPQADFFKTVICTEVLEHVYRPKTALWVLLEMMKPGGQIIITVPFAFPVHDFPDDFHRYTPSCLDMMLQEVGFTEITIAELGLLTMQLQDHDMTVETRQVPRHIAAVAWKPGEN